MRKTWDKLLAGGLPAGFRPIGGGEADTAMKDRLAELKTAAKAFIEDNENIVRTAGRVEVDGPDGQKITATRIDAERKTRFDSNLEQLHGIKAEVDSIEKMIELRAWGDGTPGASVATAAAAALAGGHVPDNWREIRKTLGQRLIDSEDWESMKSASGIKRSMTMGVTSFKDVYSDLPTGTPGTFGRVQRDPIVPMAQRTARVRDLFTAVNTDAALIEFFRITGFANAASMVPERDGSAFALKPHSSLSVEGQQAAVRTIAHWEVAHRNVLDDEPQLRGIIDNELLYGLALTEDYQILQGTGTGQDLLGILNTPGVQSYAQGTADATETNIDSIRHAVTLSFLANYEATGIVLHPLDWEEMELQKDSQGRYILFAFAVDGVATPRLWRLPVVSTPAIPANTGLVGSFGLGATLYDRQQSNIRVAEQHDDYFIRNAVVILAEERLALATKRPESFVKVTNLHQVIPA